MDLEAARDLARSPDVSHEVRRLGFFRASFRRSVALVAGHYGVAVEIDETKLTAAFLDWTEEFSRQKALAAADRRDFAVFAAGLLLRELLRAEPITVRGRPQASDDPGAAIAAFWPEGFLSTNYCVSVLDAIFSQEFSEKLTLSPDADDLRRWWSFRESVAEDPTLAIGFLDDFLGREPNWALPGRGGERPAMRRAGAGPALAGPPLEQD